MKGKAFFLSLFLIVSLILPLYQISKVKAQQNGAWVNRYVYDVDYGNGTHRSTSHIEPQVFWDNTTDSWQELKFVYDSVKKYYLLQNSHMSLRAYLDKPSSYYDPDNQRLCVEKEIVTVEYEEKGKWQIVDLKNPVFTVVKNESSEVRLTKTLSGKDGVLNVTYILKSASRLKHDLIFQSYFLENKTFRVHFRLEGVPSLKVKSPKGTEVINGTESIGKVPYFMFGENNTNLVLTEYLWSLGVTNETTGEWNATVLQDVILDVEAGKGKADIIIGNYTLAQDESLLIDPDTDTFYSSSADGRVYHEGTDWNTVRTAATGTGEDSDETKSISSCQSNFVDPTYYICRSFFYFDTSTIDDEAIISTAILHVYGYVFANSDVSAQKGTQADTLTTADYNAFTGSEYGHVAWAANQYNQITFNAQGKTDINKLGVTKICAREYSHDYSDSAPTGTNRDGCYFAEETGTDKDPKLEVTWEAEAGEEYTADLSQSLTTTWSVLTEWDAILDFSQALSTSWTILTKTTFNIVASLSNTFSWIVDVVHTVGGIAYIADLSQAISTTWSILTQWNAITDLSQSLTTTWTVLIQSSFNIVTSLSNTFTWTVEIYHWVFTGYAYTVDLSLAILTSWIVDVVHTPWIAGGPPSTFGTLGFIVALIALALVVTLIAKKRS